MSKASLLNNLSMHTYLVIQVTTTMAKSRWLDYSATWTAYDVNFKNLSEIIVFGLPPGKDSLVILSLLSWSC